MNSTVFHCLPPLPRPFQKEQHKMSPLRWTLWGTSTFQSTFVYLKALNCNPFLKLWVLGQTQHLTKFHRQFFSYCYYLTHIATHLWKKVSSPSRESSTLGAGFWVLIPGFPNYWLCDWEQVTWFLWAAGCFCKYSFVGTWPTPSFTHCQQLLSHDNNKVQRLRHRLCGPASRNLTLNPGHLFTIWSFPEEICNHRTQVFY